MTVLAIDAGKTGSRAALVLDGQRTATATGPGIPNVAEPGGVDGIRSVLAQLLAALPAPAALAGACIGLTGVLEPTGHARTVRDVLGSLVTAERLVVTSDVVTTYCGALGLQPGVVVAAGTGAITLAADADGHLARTDGWGYLLDDAGSAFAIGRRGLRAALRAQDGRGSTTALLAAAKAAYGGVDGVLDAVYGAANPAREIAAFAPQVSEAAAAGDPTAAAILAGAGRELAAAAVAAARRVGLDRPAVSWHGGVFAVGDPVLRPFLEEVLAALPGAQPRPPAGDALDGAAALAAAAGSTVLDRLLATGTGVPR